MAQSAWVAMTRETVQRQSANRTGPRVDAGVKELSEMTIGRTDDPENPILATAGQPGRVIVWGWIAEPIWASGQPAAPTGRTHDRNRTARQISSSSLLHPRGRPHMRVGHRPAAADPPWMKKFYPGGSWEQTTAFFLLGAQRRGNPPPGECALGASRSTPSGIGWKRDCRGVPAPWRVASN
jgi:hypothetical protein